MRMYSLAEVSFDPYRSEKVICVSVSIDSLVKRAEMLNSEVPNSLVREIVTSVASVEQSHDRFYTIVINKRHFLIAEIEVIT